MKILRGCVVLALLLSTLIWTATSQSKGKKHEKITIKLEIKNGTLIPGIDPSTGYPFFALHGDVYLKKHLVGTYDEIAFPTFPLSPFPCEQNLPLGFNAAVGTAVFTFLPGEIYTDNVSCVLQTIATPPTFVLDVESEGEFATGTGIFEDVQKGGFMSSSMVALIAPNLTGSFETEVKLELQFKKKNGKKKNGKKKKGSLSKKDIERLLKGH